MLSDRASDHVHGGRDFGTDFVDGFPCWLRPAFRSRPARTESDCFDQSIRWNHHRYRDHRRHLGDPLPCPRFRCHESRIVARALGVVLAAILVQEDPASPILQNQFPRDHPSRQSHQVSSENRR